MRQKDKGGEKLPGYYVIHFVDLPPLLMHCCVTAPAGTTTSENSSRQVDLDPFRDENDHSCCGCCSMTPRGVWCLLFSIDSGLITRRTYNARCLMPTTGGNRTIPYTT